MIVNEINKTVTIENPFEILGRQIALFGKSEEHTRAIYLHFLEKDGYRQNNAELTFYSFDELNESNELEAYMHFEKDRGIVFKEDCFKIVLSKSFHEFVKSINKENIKVIK